MDRTTIVKEHTEKLNKLFSEWKFLCETRYGEMFETMKCK